MKELSEMSLQELYELFPIILKDHDPEYKNWYQEEEQSLISQCGQQIVRISHIGSTAVDGLIAKPTVDILMEIKTDTNLDELKNKLSKMGWGLMNQTQKPKFKQTYNKGYTKYGFADKVYHLHVRYLDDWDELYFRDYLIEHSDVAAEYAKLKLGLKERFEHDRDAYTDAKSEFVSKVSKEARKAYPGRYR